MMNENLYRETFSRLCASDKAKKEVLMKMQEQTKKKRLPKLLRTAAIAAILTVVLAVTADAASGGNLLDGLLFTIVSSDGIHETWVDEDGNEFNVISIGGGTEIQDGRVILKAMGEEEDITDTLEAEGIFTKTYDAEGMEVVITVTGTVEDHTVEIVTPEVTISPATPAVQYSSSSYQVPSENSDDQVGLTFISENTDDCTGQ